MHTDEKIAVFIGATGGPVRILGIANEDVPLSEVAVGRADEPLQPVSDEYDIFTRRGGALEQSLGPFPAPSFRLSLGSPISSGDSWKLAAYFAHALKEKGMLAEGDEQFTSVVWATGAIDRDLKVQSVTHVQEKLFKSSSLFDSLEHDGIPVRKLVPSDCQFDGCESVSNLENILPFTIEARTYERKLAGSVRGNRVWGISIIAVAIAFAGLAVILLKGWGGESDQAASGAGAEEASVETVVSQAEASDKVVGLYAANGMACGPNVEKWVAKEGVQGLFPKTLLCGFRIAPEVAAYELTSSGLERLPQMETKSGFWLWRSDDGNIVELWRVHDDQVLKIRQAQSGLDDIPDPSGGRWDVPIGFVRVVDRTDD